MIAFIKILKEGDKRYITLIRTKKGKTIYHMLDY